MIVFPEMECFCNLFSICPEIDSNCSSIKTSEDKLTSKVCSAATDFVTIAGLVVEVEAETTANWRVVSITHPSISATELGYLNGATSNIQTQLNEKATDSNTVHKTGDETIAGVKTFSNNVGIGTSSPIGTLDVTQKNSDTANEALVLRGYTTGANGTRNCNTDLC